MGVLLLEDGTHWGRIVYEKNIIVKKSAKNAKIMVCPIIAELPKYLLRLSNFF
jgi:hypothetical protein